MCFLQSVMQTNGQSATDHWKYRTYLELTYGLKQLAWAFYNPVMQTNGHSATYHWKYRYISDQLLWQPKTEEVKPPTKCNSRL
jgi:hypothetical protein